MEWQAFARSYIDYLGVGTGIQRNVWSSVHALDGYTAPGLSQTSLKVFGIQDPSIEQSRTFNLEIFQTAQTTKGRLQLAHHLHMSWAGVPWQPGIQASSCGQRLCGALGTVNLRHQLDNKEQQKIL
ncbi:hypothetical protein I7I51_02170 [Histoplasma capsulatum]|uniref:Uncharacterized protein n=1 Tax=Ajellomyces capsulatus TaxID=5037 RepID=A0A8A1MCI6_AJECA|nr:hypothetical protein I7I51_02170 [Histoplasma capsulatum]